MDYPVILERDDNDTVLVSDNEADALQRNGRSERGRGGSLRASALPRGIGSGSRGQLRLD